MGTVRVFRANTGGGSENGKRRNCTELKLCSWERPPWATVGFNFVPHQQMD